MKISNYLNEIQHAVNLVLPEIYREHGELTKVRRELKVLNAVVEDAYDRVNFFMLNPDLDDEGIGTGLYYDTYFGSDKERHHKDIRRAKLEDQIAVHEFSVAALSGSILQYAKQGISLQYGKVEWSEKCPDGRIVAGLAMPKIIWEARNQAMHWDEHSLNKAGVVVFEQLASKQSSKFAQFNERNLAFDVLDLLGWTSVDAMFTDMLMLS